MHDIPGYTFLRLLGRGGMAAVYLARQESLGREVALKVLPPGQDAAGDTVAAERFLREARIAASLRHSNIVPIHDFGVHEGAAYIAMQYEAGGTVAPMAGEKLPPRDALRVVRDVAAALDYAHGRGVVHRDIKPENILRRDDGAAMLSDFGIARLIQGDSVLTTEGTSIGTPHYMSPEQLRGEKVDGRSDLYSLGVVLWQLLTGELPFTGTDGWAVGTQHISADIPRLPPALASLQPLVDDLLAKRPEARLQTGGDLVRRVDALLSGTVTPATVVAAPTLDEHPRSEHPAAARVPAPPRLLRSVAIAAVLAALAAVAWWQFAPGARVARSTPTAGKATPAAARAPASIAVMPFDDLSAAHDQGYFSDGIAEELQGRLAQVPGLQVAGRSSARSFKGKAATVMQIGKALSVGSVLEGTVRKDGDQLRVSVQLSDARTGFQIWEQRYDRKLVDVFAVQEDIATAVVDALRPTLQRGSAVPASKHHKPPFEAYDAYLLGRQSLVSGRSGTLAVGLASYRKAVAIDPEYAEAWSGLAMAESFTAEHDPLGGAAGKARAMAAAERAVTLDPALGDAYAARGYLRGNAWEWTGALADVLRSVELAPRDGRNLMRKGYLLATLNRLPEARAALEEAVRAEPLLLPAWQRLVVTTTAQGDYAAAEAAIRRVAQLDPNSPSEGYDRALIDLLQGRPAAARPALEKAGDAAATLMADFSLGKKAQARAGLARLASSNQVDDFSLSAACAWMGDFDCAFAALDAVASRGGMGSLRIPYDPFLQPLRSDPRYARLMTRMGLPVAATH